MSALYIVFLGLVAMVHCQTPKKCCLPSNFTAILTNTSQINGQFVEYSEFYYDFDIKMDAQRHFRLNPGSGPTQQYRLVNDYNQGKLYTITPDGKCKSFKNPLKMFPSCIPDEATYLGSSYVGLPMGVPYDGWRYTLQDITITIAVTKDSCVPLIEGIKGKGKFPPDVAYFFNNYDSPIKDRSAFAVPPGC